MNLYCTECAITDGKGTEEARYVIHGRSVCYHHFWLLANEGERMPLHGTEEG